MGVKAGPLQRKDDQELASCSLVSISVPVQNLSFGSRSRDRREACSRWYRGTELKTHRLDLARLSSLSSSLSSRAAGRNEGQAGGESAGRCAGPRWLAFSDLGVAEHFGGEHGAMQYDSMLCATRCCRGTWQTSPRGRNLSLLGRPFPSGEIVAIIVKPRISSRRGKEDFAIYVVRYLSRKPFARGTLPPERVPTKDPQLR